MVVALFKSWDIIKYLLYAVPVHDTAETGVPCVTSKEVEFLSDSGFTLCFMLAVYSLIHSFDLKVSMFSSVKWNNSTDLPLGLDWMMCAEDWAHPEAYD